MCSVLVSDNSGSKQVIKKGSQIYVPHSWSPGLGGLYCPPSWLRHYLELPGPLFQARGTTTKFLRDAEENGISRPGVPSVINNPAMSSSKLPSLFVHRFLQVECETKAALQDNFRAPPGGLLQHSFLSWAVLLKVAWWPRANQWEYWSLFIFV